MAEWLKAAVLKTVEAQVSVGSNPTPSATRRAMRAAVWVCATATVVAACESPTPPPPTPSPSAFDTASTAWRELPTAPLSPRHDAVALWTGSEVVVLGGTDAQPCPPGARCAFPPEPGLSDGARYDPARHVWAEVSPAPVPINWASGAVLGDRLFLWVAAGVSGNETTVFLAYDLDADRWERLALPDSSHSRRLRLVAAGNRLVAFHQSQELGTSPDLVFDPAAGTWSEMPADPLATSFDRDMVWTGDVLVLFGLEVVPQPGSAQPSLYRAAALDPATGAWRRYPDSEITLWNPVWFYADGRIVNPSIWSADGGQTNNWGRSYPTGGMLDPVAGAWSPLPAPPSVLGPYVGPAVGADAWVVSDAGWALHVPAGTWIQIPELAALEAGQAAAWAGDRLIVWGGYGWDGKTATNLADGWEWVP